MRYRSLGHRAPLLWLCLPLMAGIAVAPSTYVLSPRCATLLAAGFGVIALLASHQGGNRPWLVRWAQSIPPWSWAPALAGALVFAGAALFQQRNPRVATWDKAPPREVRTLIRVHRIFPRHDGTAAGLGTIVTGHGRIRELAGQRVYFSLRGSEAAPVRSAVIRATAVLLPVPHDAAAGSFDGYLASAGAHFRMSRGRIDGFESPPSAYYAFLERAADRMNTWLSAGIMDKRPDLAAVYRAMMLGQKHELSQEQDDTFMHSGTMHLFAINGLHIGVVALSLHALLALLRCPRPLAAVVTLAVLWFDVDTTGASPSAVRAFVLVACYEAGFVLRRPANGLATLSGAALVMLLVDPNTLFTASFQMSYSVVLAILCLGLPFSEWLDEKMKPFAALPKVNWRWWQRSWGFVLRWFWPVFGIGLSASLVSAITGPEFFNVIAPAGFFANLVLVPVAMLVIVAGFASVLTGALGLLPLTVLFNHAALLLLVGIDFTIRHFVAIPSAWRPAHWRVAWAAPLVLAVLLASILYGYAERWHASRGAWWPPFVIAGLAVVIGVKFG